MANLKSIFMGASMACVIGLAPPALAQSALTITESEAAVPTAVKPAAVEAVAANPNAALGIVAAPTVEAEALVADTPATLSADEILFWINNTWMLVATFLVFIMHLGFSALEAGLTQSKNTVNILFKNLAVISIGILTYALVGFNLMYPGAGFEGAYFGFSGFGIGTDAAGVTMAYNPGYTYWTDFIFQGMFAATAATIVSGAVAERIKLGSFLLFATLFVAICYPMIGMWQWGGGWLSTLGFHDFAGSTLVHAVGGWGALAGVIALGPRAGKYVNGSTKPIMGHNMPLAAMGVFFLWFGWYGFNGGSVLSASPSDVSLVVVTTSLAAAAGVLGAAFTSWIVQKQPDLSMALNGALAGLVGITAGADCIGVMDSVIVGGIAGIIVVFSVLAFDKIKLDDPVGALSVHLVCGIWGTLAVGIFGVDKSFSAQVIGTLAAGAFAFPFALVLFMGIKATMGLRVSEKEELRGLDIEEHGMESYAGFQIFTMQ